MKIKEFTLKTGDSLFKSSSFKIVISVLNMWSYFHGLSKSTVTLYLIEPKLPSNDVGKLIGSGHEKLYEWIPAWISMLDPVSDPIR